jgi:hypothetical protein
MGRIKKYQTNEELVLKQREYSNNYIKNKKIIKNLYL